MEMSRKFAVEKLEAYLKLVGRRIVRQTIGMESLEIREPAEACYDAPGDDGPWEPISVGHNWGDAQQWTHFRAKVTVPADWQGGAIDLHMKHRINYCHTFAVANQEAAGPEGQVFINGQRAGAIDQVHHSLRFDFKPGQTYEIRCVFFAGRVACNHFLECMHLAWVDTPAEKLYHDFRVALEIAKELDVDSVARQRLIDLLEAVVRAIDVREVSEVAVPVEAQRDTDGKLFFASVAQAQKVFDEELAKIKPAGEAEGVVAVGHAHIDLAWLWPASQTRHKDLRTFATQCRLLDQYDEWVFNQSSPQAYKWLEKDGPDLFERIKKHIAAGRWEAEGAMWCEADTNVPSGESLVRQLLYGKRYFKNRLGVDSRFLWLPDVFGYTAALPQLLKLADVDGFVTSKISWSQYNRFPYDTFRWKGLDGTEIPTHFITTPCENSWFLTYNAMMTPKEVKGMWHEYRQKPLLTEPLMSFGYGDGGGGPTEEMIETALRMSKMPAVAGMPKVKLEGAGALMKRVCADVDRMPIWDGELYLEYHRGTYTTQAWLKRANRKNEIQLHNVEWLSCLAGDLYHLDKEALDAAWEDLLLSQFHDILPGSSVDEVYYEEIKPMQQAITDKTNEMIAAATDAIAAKVDTSAAAKPEVVFNTLSWDRTDPVKLSDGTWRDDVTIPAGGWTVVDAAAEISSADDLTVSEDGRQLDNQFWSIRLDDQGRISQLYDKRDDRQVLAGGEVGNEWQVFEDRPMAHPAWDIDLYYREHPLEAPILQSLEVVEKTPVRIAVEMKWEMPRISDGPHSTITQRMAIYARNPRIDFETNVDWHEHHQLLKVAFPVDVRTTEATYEVQFGHLRRPTHENTSWDLARFETCGHKFVDLSEHGYGVALLNDCKYGHDISKNVIRLTCIKSPQAPDPIADQGHHEFTYSLLPHSGSFQDAGVVQAARELNIPAIARAAESSAGTLAASQAFVGSDNPGVVIDTVKPAEDGSGTIVRMYESLGSHAKATVTFANAPKSVEVVNLLEESMDDDVSLNHQGNAVSLKLRPFQVVSLKIS